MVTKEQLEKILRPHGLTVDQFEEAYKSEEETSLELKDIKTFTQEQLDELKTNVGKESYEDGKKAGIEKHYKDVRDSYGYTPEEIEGKDFDKLMQYHASKELEKAKVEPSKKIQEKDLIIQDLQGKLTEKDEAISSIKTEYVSKERNRTKREIYLNNLEGVELPAGISKDAVIYQMELDKPLSFSDEHSTFIPVDKTGNPIKDDRHNIIDVKDYFNGYADDKGWKNKEAGRGGKDNSGGNGMAGLKEVSYKEWSSGVKAKGQNPTDPEVIKEFRDKNPEAKFID